MSISAMKQALDALERGRSQIIGALVQQDQDEAITALRQAIAEAEKQEPVAQCYYPGCQTTSGCAGACSKTSPTAWAEITKEYVAVSDEPFENATPLYTKREWVGLTKDEVDSWELPEKPTVFEFAQFVEAKLKEKNCG